MSSSSSSSSSSSLPLPRSRIFTPIPENDKEEEEEAEEEEAAMHKEQPSSADVVSSNGSYVHNNPIPLHRCSTASAKGAARRTTCSRGQQDAEVVSVDCNNICRPTSRDKLITVVPLDPRAGGRGHQHSSAVPSSPGPGGLLRSLFVSLTARRSPAASSSAAIHEDQWRIVAAELSRKLLHVTRKRDEALIEASRLKYSLAELERKLERLESHCRDLRFAVQPGLDSGPAPKQAPFPAKDFHLAVADARAAVRQLARALISQVRHVPRSSDRITALIQPYDPRANVQLRRNPSSLLFYMEALLNRVLYAGFEVDNDEEAAMIDPAARCAANKAGYEAVRRLSWDEVLSKGTRHYSETLSRFCDRKMSEVVEMVGWTTRAWPEGLLQAFFGAAKGAWVVRLMARSVHPPVPSIRADRGARFDGRFMEDVAADRVGRLTPTSVRMMVAPGFYVYTEHGGGGVVKGKVLCVYCNSGSCERSDANSNIRSGRPQQ